MTGLLPHLTSPHLTSVWRSPGLAGQVDRLQLQDAINVRLLQVLDHQPELVPPENPGILLPRTV